MVNKNFTKLLIWLKPLLFIKYFIKLVKDTYEKIINC